MKPNHFFLRVWRWHFYAGLFSLPFLFILASTGIVYLFRFDIEDILYRELHFVQASSNSLPLEIQRKKAETTMKGGTLKRVMPPAAPNRSTGFLFTSATGEDFTVFVNPSDGKLLGTREEAWRPSVIAVKIHGDLLVGKTGDFLMELAASWAILLTISGLYLWLPRGTPFRIWGVLLPRLSRSGGRLPWRDIHAVTGFWVAGILAFFSFTGLFWSGIWGEKFAKPWSTFPASMWENIPKSEALNSSLNSKDSKVIPWAVENLPVPQSTLNSASDPSMGSTQSNNPDTPHAAHVSNNSAQEIAPLSLIGLDTVQRLAQEKGLLVDRTISMPVGPQGVYTVTANAMTSQEEALIHIDQYSGKVLADVRYLDYSPAAKAVSTSIALHEGRYFGTANKILALLGCLLIILLCVSAIALWWRRRPSFASFRAPSRVTLPHFWKGAILLVCVFALVFPTAGASLMVVLILDELVLKRVSALKHLF